MADLLRTLRLALVAIIRALPLDATMGRAAANGGWIVPWHAFHPDGPLPVIVYHLDDATQTGGDNDTRSLVVRLAVFAAGDGALAAIETLLAALEAGCTAAAFAAQGLDAAPGLLTRRYPAVGEGGDELAGDPQDGSRRLARGDLELPLTLVQPAAA